MLDSRPSGTDSSPARLTLGITFHFKNTSFYTLKLNLYNIQASTPGTKKDILKNESSRVSNEENHSIREDPTSSFCDPKRKPFVQR